MEMWWRWCECISLGNVVTCPGPRPNIYQSPSPSRDNHTPSQPNAHKNTSHTATCPPPDTNHTTTQQTGESEALDGPRGSICIIRDHEPTEQCVSLQCIASLECKNNGLCSQLQIPLCRLASAVPLWDASVLSVTVYHPHKYVGRAQGGGGVLIGQMCHRSDGGNVSSYFASL